jgi:hypothetical protein
VKSGLKDVIGKKFARCGKRGEEDSPDEYKGKNHPGKYQDIAKNRRKMPE